MHRELGLCDPSVHGNALLGSYTSNMRSIIEIKVFELYKNYGQDNTIEK